jgi:hypothetical protein
MAELRQLHWIEDENRKLKHLAAEVRLEKIMH